VITADEATRTSLRKRLARAATSIFLLANRISVDEKYIKPMIIVVAINITTPSNTITTTISIRVNAFLVLQLSNIIFHPATQ
jgi:hypothetical protein